MKRRSFQAGTSPSSERKLWCAEYHQCTNRLVVCFVLGKRRRCNASYFSRALLCFASWLMEQDKFIFHAVLLACMNSSASRLFQTRKFGRQSRTSGAISCALVGSWSLSRSFLSPNNDESLFPCLVSFSGRLVVHFVLTHVRNALLDAGHGT